MSPLSGVTWESPDRMLKLGINSGAAKDLKKTPAKRSVQNPDMTFHEILIGYL